MLMVQTLIANSGIQFFSREILIDPNDGFKQVFYEWFDEQQVEQVLEYAFEIKQLDKYVHYSDMLKYGFVDSAGNLLVEPNVVDANPEVRVIHKGDIGLCSSLFRMRLGDKNNCSLSKYLDIWLPAPYYEIDRSGNFCLVLITGVVSRYAQLEKKKGRSVRMYCSLLIPIRRILQTMTIMSVLYLSAIPSLRKSSSCVLMPTK